MGIFSALTTALTGIHAQFFAIENISAESAMAAEVVVDEEWYFEAYPDVRAAVEDGRFKSARHHYRTCGFLERRLPSKSVQFDLIETNKQRIAQEIAEGICEVKSLPYDIQFSPEHRCSLRCVMCASTVWRNQGVTPLMDRRLPNNTLERFKKLEPYIPYFETVSLTGSGEPLISPAFPDILEILSKNKSVSIGFTTHAQVFDRARAELLVRSGIREIAISMDGACKETYEKIRVNAKWEKLLRSIDLLNQVKNERHSSMPHICFATNCMRQNIEELPALVDFAHAHRGQKVLATNTIIYDTGMEHESLLHYPDLTRQMVVETIRRAKRLGIQFDNRVLEPPEGLQVLEAEAAALERQSISGPHRLSVADVDNPAVPIEAPRLEAVPRGSTNASKETISIGGHNQSGQSNIFSIPEIARPQIPKTNLSDILNACQMPWAGLMVESDGNAKVCCYESPHVGNLNDQTFEEIWNGAPIVALRRSFVDGRPPEGCRNCFIFTKSQQRKDVFLQLMPTRHFNIEYPEKDCILQGIVGVGGWAIDQEKVSKIEIMINDKIIGEATLGLQRPDVGEIFPKFETAAAGFSFTVDTRMLADGNQMFALGITNGIGKRVEVGHRTVKVQNMRPIADYERDDSRIARTG
jgi:MoaA/NifB/PqqE/SkfB family radical SAM enzyme